MSSPEAQERAEALRNQFGAAVAFGDWNNAGQAFLDATRALRTSEERLERCQFVCETNDESYRQMRAHYDQRLQACEAALRQLVEFVNAEHADSMGAYVGAYEGTLRHIAKNARAALDTDEPAGKT